MTKFINIVKSFTKDESGAAMVEYSILIGLIAAATIAAVVLVGLWVTGAWDVLVANLGAPPAVGP